MTSVGVPVPDETPDCVTSTPQTGTLPPHTAALLATPQHQCKPSTLARVIAHDAPSGTEVKCPCGKTWSVTKHHLGSGRICGCGWERIA